MSRTQLHQPISYGRDRYFSVIGSRIQATKSARDGDLGTAPCDARFGEMDKPDSGLELGLGGIVPGWALRCEHNSLSWPGRETYPGQLASSLLCRPALNAVLLASVHETRTYVPRRKCGSGCLRGGVSVRQGALGDGALYWSTWRRAKPRSRPRRS